MYHFEYVDKNTAKPYREEFESIIHEVQDLIRDKFTFQFQFIGSSARNMITYDPRTNIGFDFDVNLFPNDDEEQYSAKEIKTIYMNALNQVIIRRGFQYCENSTRVITIKKLHFLTRSIEYSCDFAIVNDYEDDHGNLCQEYIRFNKKTGSYTWEQQTSGYHIEEQVQWIKDNHLWNDVLDLYLYKKNTNTAGKKSRALYAETIHEICQQNGYYR